LKENTPFFKLGNLQESVRNHLLCCKSQNIMRRLLEKDHTLWSPDPIPEISDRLGWLNLPNEMEARLQYIQRFAEDIRKNEFDYAVLLGMGGSSLAPEVFKETFGSAHGCPELIVCDSTHPDAIKHITKTIELKKTLFIVSSKSGTTIETLSFFRYFWHLASKKNSQPGDYFVAITDAGTPLEKLAIEREFRAVFKAPSDVGGRFSAFTEFGLVPASLIGVPVSEVLLNARAALFNCFFKDLNEKNSALILATALGELAHRENKLTFITSPSLQSFPSWLEQLISESLGKDGKGLIPVVDEPLASIDSYGKDRAFVYFYIKGEESKEVLFLLKSLEENGHPTIMIPLAKKEALGQEIFRWEVAVAVAGSILKINPFNQPDVVLTKELTRKMMDMNKEGTPQETHSETIDTSDSVRLKSSFAELLSLSRLGDYIVIQAFLPPNKKTKNALQDIRLQLLNRTQLATTIGFGPRFLHSTGQLHKGGPNNGIFVQLVDDSPEDIDIPETQYSFRTLIKAQSLGDFHALKQKGRRIIRINLGKVPLKGLEAIAGIISS